MMHRHTQDSRLILQHTLHSAVELKYAGQTLFRYVYESGAPAVESPKPYFHPLRTLAGNEVTIYRPHDHVWHKGLQMTSAHLSGQNFWGGPTYINGQGYVQLDNNGRIQHERWTDLRCEDQSAELREELRWITANGETWIREKRRITVSEINVDESYWALDFEFWLDNTRHAPLVFGSPTTQGRPMAGYGGLFWRGPRSFTGGRALAAGGLEGPDIMGRRAPWLAFIGSHDGTADSSTLIFIDNPANINYPNKWFVRTEPFAAVSFAFSFDEEYVLAAGDALALTYRIIIADGAWTREQIAQLAESNYLK
ncbi:MAG: PmoA family protein [Anaerolineae bacterium]|nr:PmoA family protein [Thermoflexales bacterium]MDW8407249.1 PmoA family protein [Anaerolineae bacterium]